MHASARTSARRLTLAALALLLAPLVVLTAQQPAGASTLPAGFRDSVVLSGLNNPTVVQFAADGRVFVAQKDGVCAVHR